MPRPSWPKEHLDILRDKYPTQGANIPELLAHYKPGLIRATASIRKIGYVSNRYSVEEVDYIKRNYDGRLESIGDFLKNRSDISLYCAVSNYGLAKQGKEKHEWGVDVSPKPEWCNWFSGLSDGEACFGIASGRRQGDRYRPNCFFSISLRIDDGAVLEDVEMNLKVGHTRKTDLRNQRALGRNVMDCVKYQISNRDHLARVLIPLFEMYPLRSKKGKEFPLWREAVFESIERPSGYVERMMEIIQELRKMRAGASR